MVWEEEEEEEEATLGDHVFTYKHIHAYIQIKMVYMHAMPTCSISTTCSTCILCPYVCTVLKQFLLGGWLAGFE